MTIQVKHICKIHFMLLEHCAIMHFVCILRNMKSKYAFFNNSTFKLQIEHIQTHTYKVCQKLNFTFRYGGLPPIACALEDLWSDAPIFPLEIEGWRKKDEWQALHETYINIYLITWMNSTTNLLKIVE